ncbi:hypothetical protein TFKS16_1040 [Tannerella forsythia KS16]|uniref:Uncharacterized protein n=1 Tax=Tannerella forsythia (strain ATCC 43037 / JCM 10827 / CCUG 21028 A / KCTC 5666 / FDC 338) TaxID=203275 RepID=G8UHV3_TANFA|nr:hypothetical protein BFO_1123 [Tannerella forsythia 92A2]BAR51319.1 hypothetical protein TFKS16_1040 [Tannerella forsythia KS16]
MKVLYFAHTIHDPYLLRDHSPKLKKNIWYTVKTPYICGLLKIKKT